ncbi:cilia- and flagella-associated protein 276 [Cololabis saira]|uniref:cilia- and flagella-associated protein 276 n=1 Tax=Cololabis saira TaxID=129043 RepID=UPI002AD2C172|nr:cilia- and flagella-associated protein 276 [Cololabis saira]
MSSRNPYPSTKYENDLTLGGFKPQQITYKEPCHITQTEEPWSRLHNTATLASTQRRAIHYRPQAQNSSLDFHLNSIYDHQRNLFWDSNQIVYQKETVLGYRKREV